MPDDDRYYSKPKPKPVKFTEGYSKREYETLVEKSQKPDLWEVLPDRDETRH